MITEQQKEDVLKILELYKIQENRQIRDIENDCPILSFTEGYPSGECESDGHYMCINCRNFCGTYKWQSSN